MRPPYAFECVRVCVCVLGGGGYLFTKNTQNYLTFIMFRGGSVFEVYYQLSRPLGSYYIDIFLLVLKFLVLNLVFIHLSSAIDLLLQ